MKIRFWKKKEIVKEPKIKNINKCFRFVNNKPEFRLFYYYPWESFDQFISNFFVGEEKPFFVKSIANILRPITDSGKIIIISTPKGNSKIVDMIKNIKTPEFKCENI